MASIFELKTNTTELASSNQGTSQMCYEQHPPTRDVVGDNFPNGAIHIRFQTSGQKWWVPSRSYIRMRAKLTKPNGAILTLDDDVAPNMGLCANLFQSAEFRIADKTVSRVSDYMPQIDALETRLTKSKSWIDSVGNASNWWQDEMKERQAEVTSDGFITDTVVDANDRNAPSNIEDRLQIGLDAAGGGGADRNALSYVDATGVLTLAQNGGAALPAATSVLFPVGSYIRYTVIQGAAAGDARINKVAKVLSHPSATTIQVAPASIGGDVVADGRTDFQSLTASVDSTASNQAREISDFEMVWQPPLSIFKVGHAMPAGKYELVLNPQTTTQYKKRAIESLLGDKAPKAGAADNDFQFQVVDMYLYCATVDGPRGDDQTYLLDLEETRCQVDNIDSGGGFQQKNFDVSPSSYALTCAFQDTRAGNLTQYSASKFKIDGENSDELSLSRMFINYAGQNRPAPDADPSFIAGTDYTIQRYTETQLYSGAYFDCGGAETINEWHGRGAIYYFSWPKDGTDRSTRVNTHFGFNQPAPAGIAAGNGRVLLFDHSRKVARVRVQDGRVVDVQVEDA